jgi:hypothetical protein
MLVGFDRAFGFGFFLSCHHFLPVGFVIWWFKSLTLFFISILYYKEIIKSSHWVVNGFFFVTTNFTCRQPQAEGAAF